MNVFTNVVLPIALAVIMLGMGMSLRLNDFTRIFLYPIPTIIGLICQLILLPVTAFLLIFQTGIDPALKVGVMILAFCPGGASSNLITYLARGDAALSITLTAFSSLITVFSAPFLINLSLQHFMSETQAIQLPLIQTITRIALMTVLPVSIGMFLFAKFPHWTQKVEGTVKILSGIFLVIAVLGALAPERENLSGYFQQVGLLMLLLNLLTLGIGYGISRLARLNTHQATTIAIEGGIQNGTMAILIAGTILKQQPMTIPAAVYSLIMFATCAVIIYVASKKLPPKQAYSASE